MTNDPTEMPRRMESAVIHNERREQARLQVKYGIGNVWNTDELSRDFKVVGFLAPFCVVERKTDGRKGSVQFQHSPRFYFNFVLD